MLLPQNAMHFHLQQHLKRLHFVLIATVAPLLERLFRRNGIFARQLNQYQRDRQSPNHLERVRLLI